MVLGGEIIFLLKMGEGGGDEGEGKDFPIPRSHAVLGELADVIFFLVTVGSSLLLFGARGDSEMGFFLLGGRVV